MAGYYADSSVLVKRHVAETGSAWVQSLCDPQANHLIMTSRISQAEVFSALNRRRRESALSQTDYAALANDFTAVLNQQYQIIECMPAVVLQTRRLLEQYSLRAFDAIQLSSALLANQLALAQDLSAIVFLSADTRLTTAAQSEGLLVDNPNHYP